MGGIEDTCESYSLFKLRFAEARDNRPVTRVALCNISESEHWQSRQDRAAASLQGGRQIRTEPVSILTGYPFALTEASG
jgi:hypothetical protein